MFQHKRKLGIIVSIVVLSFALISAEKNDEQPAQKVQHYFSHQLDSLESKLITYQESANAATDESLRKQFLDCREIYKRVEFLVEYLYPAAANGINGAPLLEAEASEPEEPQHPTGFQVLEGPVYEEITEDSRKIIANEISSIIFQVNKVQKYVRSLQLQDDMIFDALRLNTYRLMAKGLSGFDSPVAFNSIPEARETLESMMQVLSYYNASQPLIKKGIAAIDFANMPASDFNGFDRALFISAYLNPLLHELNRFQAEKGVSFITDARALDPMAKDQFQQDAYNMYYFAPSGTKAASPELIALGKKLFYDPRLSSNGKRSCGGCHKPEKAFTDGLAVNMSVFGDKQLMRNTPTLINAALQPVQFSDSRIAFLEDQIHDVVSNKQEMGGDFNAILEVVKKDEQYQQQFANAFKNERAYWSKANIKKAMAAYVRSLTSLDSRFDQYMRGDAQAMNREEILGFNLFMGKGKCGTCHFTPLFSGAVPPLYDKMESEVLGVPSTPDTLHPVLDADSGKFHLYKMPHQLRSFKTPGLRNVALTAPYMHNGVFKTLDEVMDFYNKGGGAGLGFDLPNQTLPPDRLELTAQEKKAIIAFLHALTDTALIDKGL